jgi:hypothetical protein
MNPCGGSRESRNPYDTSEIKELKKILEKDGKRGGFISSFFPLGPVLMMINRSSLRTSQKIAGGLAAL